MYCASGDQDCNPIYVGISSTDAGKTYSTSGYHTQESCAARLNYYFIIKTSDRAYGFNQHGNVESKAYLNQDTNI